MKCLVIAEAGVNHNGDLALAKKLIEVAAESGAHFVKFQTFKAKKIVSLTAKKAEYQIENTGSDEGQYEMLKKLELSEEDHFALIAHCQACNISFLSTPFDEESANFLEDKVSLYKIPSGELTNIPYIEFLAKKKMPIVLSTGMGTMEEVEEAVSMIRQTWKNVGLDEEKLVHLKSGHTLSQLTLLHCTTDYPADLNSVNLLAMNRMKEQLQVKVGYSDHTAGIDVSLWARALGAVIIEKHFTLDKNMPGPDHAASLDPVELKSLMIGLEKVERTLGDGQKNPSNKELKNIEIVRKSLFYKNDFKKGHQIGRDDIEILRPGSGLPPKDFYRLIGKTLKNNVKAQDSIRWEDIR